MRAPVLCDEFCEAMGIPNFICHSELKGLDGDSLKLVDQYLGTEGVER